MKTCIVISDESVSRIILNNIQFEAGRLTCNFGFRPGITADIFINQSNEIEPQPIDASSIINLELPSKEIPLDQPGTEFGNPISVFPQPVSHNILPIPLLGIAVPSLGCFSSHLEDLNHGEIMTLHSEDAYYLSHDNNGIQFEMFWLSTRFWGSCQWNGSHYTLRVVHVMGPLPITWRVLHATPLPDDSLLGFVISRCKIPTQVTRPAVRCFSRV